MKQPQSITSLPSSPDAERHQRMLRYSIAMSIRVVCIILCFFVQGPWLALPILGAIVLPYIAVVLANVGSNNGGTVERPGALVHVPSDEGPAVDDGARAARANGADSRGAESREADSRGADE